MKKAPLSPQHQARRRRALERFTIAPKSPGQAQADYDAYVVRKNAEYDALRARLGI